MNKKSRILVTGCTGMVGKNLVLKFNKQGYQNIIVYSRNHIDLTDIDDVRRIFVWEEPEYVFHTAAVVGGIQANIDNPYKFLFDNLQIQNNIINFSIDYGVKKVLFLGSSCVYPKDFIQPLKEEYLLQAPLEPTNEGYAIAKIAGLKLCEYANKIQDKTKFISLMPCNLYGPYDHFDSQKSHFISALISKIVNARINNEKEVVVWGTGEAKREVLFVEDLVDCMLWAMENIDKTDTFLNVGSGVDYTIRQYAQYIKNICFYDGELVFDITKPEGMKQKLLDISKIKSLGWEPKTDIFNGLIKTIDFYKILRG